VQTPGRVSKHELCANKFIHQALTTDGIHSTVRCYGSANTRPCKQTRTVCRQIYPTYRKCKQDPKGCWLLSLQ